MLRLRWYPLSSPDPEKAIAVIEDVTDAHSHQTGYSATHPIANEPATDPPVSSIDFISKDLDIWEYYWWQIHREHTANDPSGAIWKPAPRRECGEGGGGKILMRCSCGSRKPPKAALFRRTLYATSQPFVTVNDYITAVHAYFQWAKPPILYAKTINRPDTLRPLTESTPLYIVPGSLTSPYLVEDAPENVQFGQDWESIADVARERVHQITVNYLYNTFPPPLLCWEWTWEWWGGPVKALPTVTNTLHGSSRKAMDMYFNWYPPVSMMSNAASIS